MTEDSSLEYQRPEKKRFNWKRLILFLCSLLLIIGFVSIKIIIPNLKYEESQRLYELGYYEEAIESFNSLGDYKNSKEMLLAAKYDDAILSYENEDYDIAIEKFEKLEGHKSSEEKIRESLYFKAIDYAREKQWNSAINTMSKVLGFRDSEELIKNYKYYFAITKAHSEDWYLAIEIMEPLDDYMHSKLLVEGYKYNLALEMIDESDEESAIELLATIPNYKDSLNIVQGFTFKSAKELAYDFNWTAAIELLNTIPDYANSNELIRQYQINLALDIEPEISKEIVVPAYPATVEDFELVILYMLHSRIYNYEIRYNTSYGNDYLDNQLYANIIQADLNAYSKIPEYTKLFNKIDFSSSNYDNTFSDYGKTVVHLELSSWEFDNDRLHIMDDKFRNEAYNIIEGLLREEKITASMTEREKAEVLYIWMAHNLQYDLKLSKEGYTGYGAAINKIASCGGYTALYNFLCKIVGIEVEGVSGMAGINTSDPELHIWTLANLDGEILYIDSTWGDPVPDRKNYCDMDYFAVTKEFLSKTHEFKD